ncbi:RNA polymerase sigma-70 factor [Chitinophagaceae bacterium LB-8]|uniref:RNA polymerase sigma-70 factor n=1 Tax=Paraflavisolibacter caeni TaxID=2982496 RepID=A0A9X2XNX8_9BACT|nr:RNA polymerase sigma-70 factor [Paraflavisolibacter caeni]MCU7549913.1 RNA polymerase sigma-70 factor [Paraflavisolibacter caeni]
MTLSGNDDVMLVENDDDCLRLLKKNDSAAWQYLIRIYFPVLCRFAQKILKTDVDAEDIVSDVFVKVWQKSADFADFQQVKKYLFVATRNSCLNQLRSRQREKTRHKEFTSAYEQQDDPFYKEIMYAELLAEIRREIDGLPRKMREIFILAYFKKMTNEEIANHLQLSNQTVRNQKATALAMLRKKLNHKTLYSILLLSWGLQDLF